MKAAVFLRNIGMFGTPSMPMRVSASSTASAWGSANVPAAAYTSIIGMGIPPSSRRTGRRHDHLRRVHARVRLPQNYGGLHSRHENMQVYIDAFEGGGFGWRRVRCGHGWWLERS